MSLFDPTKAEIRSMADWIAMPVPEGYFVLAPQILSKGGRVMISGDTGIGKTWITLNIARALVTGEPLFANPAWPVKRSKTLVLDAEVGIPFRKRAALTFRDIPESLKDFDYLPPPEGFSLSDLACMNWLRDVCKEREYEVLLIDPIGELTVMDENNREIAELFMRLRDIQSDKMSIIFTHHNRKPPEQWKRKDFDPLDLHENRGGTKFSTGCDAVMMLHRVGPINSQARHVNFRLEAGWRKTRHAEEPFPDGSLLFNEHNDGRMIWRGPGQLVEPVQAPLPAALRRNLFAVPNPAPAASNEQENPNG